MPDHGKKEKVCECGEPTEASSTDALHSKIALPISRSARRVNLRIRVLQRGYCNNICIFFWFLKRKGQKKTKKRSAFLRAFFTWHTSQRTRSPTPAKGKVNAQVLSAGSVRRLTLHVNDNQRVVRLFERKMRKCVRRAADLPPEKKERKRKKEKRKKNKEKKRKKEIRT